jgi:protein-S-isoprenylcysteine O-methyltransferase Ste14
MGLDIRLPIGGMFALVGLLLSVYGILTTSDAQMYTRSLLININLWWGIVMLIFGLLMLFFGWRSAAAQGVHPAMESEEGRATEKREHRLGIEKED